MNRKRMKLPQEIIDRFAKFGREGGETRAKNLSAERRREIAVAAGKESARVKKERKEETNGVRVQD